MLIIIICVYGVRILFVNFGLTLGVGLWDRVVGFIVIWVLWIDDGIVFNCLLLLVLLLDVVCGCVWWVL